MTPSVVRLDHTDIPQGGYKNMPGGLSGYWWETERQICIPFVDSRNPHGLLRFLRECENTGKAVVVPTVINSRFAKLLRLRGYVDAVVYVDYAKEDTDCLVKNPDRLRVSEKKQ